MKSTAIFLYLFIAVSVLSCKNESAQSSAEVTNPPTTTPKVNGDVSTLDALDHDFNITPQGSKLFLEGFFKNNLVKGAITLNKGNLHIKDGLITSGSFNLNMNTVEMVANVDESTVAFLKSDQVFDSQKYPDGKFIIEECTKALNDQQATHLIKGHIQMKGKSVPFSTKVRIDYKPKFITILTPGLKVKASDLGIKMADPSQDNLYFSLTLNGELL